MQKSLHGKYASVGFYASQVIICSEQEKGRLMKRLVMIRFGGLSLMALSIAAVGMGGKAKALTAPPEIKIDGGPLGQLELSGGMSGYFDFASGTADSSATPGSFSGISPANANLDSLLVELQKTTGVLQYTIEVGPYNGTPALGGPPAKATTNFFRTGPLYFGYITIAPPDSPVTISAGQLSSLEGYEAGPSWLNANLYTSELWYVQNSNSVGVSANYTHGPVSVTVTYGDGWDTRVFNFLQALGTYSFSSNNALSLYYAGNLGRTGADASTYNQSSVGFGNNYVNSQMYGAFYSFTAGNLNLVPEVQYVYAKVDHQAGVDKFTSNFGALVLGDYTFGSSPYSLGGMAEYFTSNGPSTWFIAPHAEAVGFELSPTWQYKNIFFRASATYLHMLNGSYAGDGTTGAYGGDGHGKDSAELGLEAGLLL